MLKNPESWLAFPPNRSQPSDDHPRVLVLLASHNGANWISEQIASIMAQRHVSISLVVSDDGSTDDTRDHVIRFMSSHSCISLLPSSTRTGSAAQNFFSLIANTPADAFDYVSFSDQDDIWFPDKTITGIQNLVANTGSGYSSATLAEWPDGKTRKIRLNNSQSTVDFLFEGAGQGCTFILTRSLYTRVRTFLLENRSLFERVHFHDWTIYALARSWDLRWHFDPTPSMIYRQHDVNDTGARLSKNGVAKRLSRIRSGWYAEQLKLISSISLAAAPENPIISQWHALLSSGRSGSRTLRLMHFCVTHGRRSTSDNVVLVISCLCHWI